MQTGERGIRDNLNARVETEGKAIIEEVDKLTESRWCARGVLKVGMFMGILRNVIVRNHV